MQQIIYFFIRNKNFLIFVFLFVVSVLLTIQSHNYHSDKFFSSANSFTGSIYSFQHNMKEYFHLRKENEKLLEENLFLHRQLEYYRESAEGKGLDTLVFPKFEYLSSVVINNNFSHSKNYLTINKGEKQGVKTDMGVVSDKGLVGIVGRVSKNYSTIQSILNTNSRINAKLQKSGHFGTLIWNTNDPNIVQLTDIPRLAEIHAGDTVTTGGRSIIFPEGIPVGTVIDFQPDSKDDNYYKVNVRLFNDMTSLQFVYLIENTEAEEILNLEKSVEDGE